MSRAKSTAADEDAPILYEPSDLGVTLITINRLHVRNAINAHAAVLLAQSLQRFESDDTQKVCVLAGADDSAFCAGYDLHEVARSAHNDHTTTTSTSTPSSAGPVVTTDPKAPLAEILAPMGPSRMLLSKPLIAAISGPAVAGGLELALLADLRVCDESAYLGVFCRRFGVPLVDGGTVRLPRIVGLGRALDMILTGRRVDAPEALGMGLVSRVVPRGRAREEAMGLARSLLGFPQACMRADRRSAYFGVFEATSLEDALRSEYERGMKVIRDEAVPGAVRFDQGQGRGGSFKLEKGKL